MRGSLKGRNFVSMRDVTHNELAELIDTAADLKRMARAGIPHRSLEGKVLGMLFQKPSLRRPRSAWAPAKRSTTRPRSSRATST